MAIGASREGVGRRRMRSSLLSGITVERRALVMGISVRRGAVGRQLRCGVERV